MLSTSSQPGTMLFQPVSGAQQRNGSIYLHPVCCQSRLYLSLLVMQQDQLLLSTFPIRNQLTLIEGYFAIVGCCPQEQNDVRLTS